MKVYIKADNDEIVYDDDFLDAWKYCIQHLYDKFYDNLETDVNTEVGYDVIQLYSGSGVQYRDVYDNLGGYIYFRVLDDSIKYANIFDIATNRMSEIPDKFSSWYLYVNFSYRKKFMVDICASIKYLKIHNVSFLNNSDISEIYSFFKDRLVSNILKVTQNQYDIKSLYDDWYERTIAPKLKVYFPNFNFSTRIMTNGDYRVIFSKDLNPWYDGKDLCSVVAHKALAAEDIDYIRDNGEPLDKFNDCVPKFVKKFNQLGIDYN